MWLPRSNEHPSPASIEIWVTVSTCLLGKLTTVKLELPSISHIQPQHSADVLWYNSFQERPFQVRDKLPAISLAPPQQPSESSSTSRFGSFDASVHSSSLDYRTDPSSYQNSVASEGKASPRQNPPLSGFDETGTQSCSEAYNSGRTSISNMNSTQSYMDMQSSHLSSAQPYASQSATAGGMPHYSQYQQSAVLQPQSNYGPPPSSYASYAYANGVTSPPQGSQSVSVPLGAQMPSQLLPLPGKIKMMCERSEKID